MISRPPTRVQVSHDSDRGRKANAPERVDADLGEADRSLTRALRDHLDPPQSLGDLDRAQGPPTIDPTIEVREPDRCARILPGDLRDDADHDQGAVNVDGTCHGKMY